MRIFDIVARRNMNVMQTAEEEQLRKEKYENRKIRRNTDVLHRKCAGKY